MSVVEVPCVKGKCCRPSTSTEFDSTHPSQLAGIISPDEFQASIGRINASLQRPKWTYRVQTSGRILIVLGIILLVVSGVKYLRMKHHHYHDNDDNNNNNNNPVVPTTADPIVVNTLTGTNQPPDDSILGRITPLPAIEQVIEQEDHHDADQKHHKKHGKCIKHIFHSGLVSLIAGIALCRWIAGRKIRQLITRVVPAICAEHHLYTSSSRAVPVSWSLDERSVCRYMCKNNGLKLVLDLHSVVPLSRMDAKPISNVAEKQQMIAGSAYVPLNTNDA